MSDEETPKPEAQESADAAAEAPATETPKAEEAAPKAEEAPKEEAPKAKEEAPKAGDARRGVGWVLRVRLAT